MKIKNQVELIAIGWEAEVVQGADQWRPEWTDAIRPLIMEAHWREDSSDFLIGYRSPAKHGDKVFWTDQDGYTNPVCVNVCRVNWRSWDVEVPCSTTSPQHPPTIRANAVESLIVHPSHAESMDGSSAL